MQLSVLLLFALVDVLRVDILIWLVSLPLLLLAVGGLVYQWRQHRHLRSELGQLAKYKRHSIEYDLVLKAMKLSVWHLDVPTRRITFDSDYRESNDSSLYPSPTRLSDVLAFMHPDFRDHMEKVMEDMVTGAADEMHEQYQMRVPWSGQTFWGETYAIVERRDEAGRPLTLVGTSLGIDRQKAIEKELTDARNKAEESDRLKSAFLANISHEVRTPLNAIVGFSDVLPMAQSEEERQQLIDLIRQNNRHLLRLFDDMMNMSKLEAGGDTVNKTRFDLNEVVLEVAEKYADRSQETGVEIRVETQADAPQPFTDRERVEEILNQYVNNAMKFTAAGSVTIGYHISGNRLTLWVGDTGKGIPSDRCNDSLFERFVKVDEFVPGTGLGLSICRSMALSLGGTVGVESTLGQGSRFWAEIPIN